MKIGARLRINTYISLAVLVLLLLSIVWSFWELSKSNRDMDLVEQMRIVAFERTALRDDYLLYKEERSLIQWNTKTEALKKLFVTASEQLTGRDEKALVTAAQKDFDATVAVFSKLIEQTKAKGRGAKEGFDSNETNARLISQIFLKAYSLIDNVSRLHELTLRERSTAQNRSIIAIIFTIVGGVIAIVINSVFINRILSKRIVALGKGVDIIGAGDLDYRILVEGDDELSALAVASNEMAAKLKESYTSVKTLHNEIQSRKRAEDDLLSSKSNLEAALASMTDAVLISDTTGKFIEFNDAFASFHRFRNKAECLRRLSDYADILEVFMDNGEPAPMEQWAVPRAIRGETVTNAVYTLRRKDTGETWVGSYSFGPIRNKEGMIVGSVVVGRDITEHRRVEKVTQARMTLFEYASGHTLEELLRKTLDEVGLLLNSPIGFYHFVEPDQKTLSLQAWSTLTLERFCKAEGKGFHYSIDKAGVWVDCVRQGKPVIHNDYASLANRKGLPEGHAEVIRELVVPILRDGLIVAILGLGNKPQEYTEQDVKSVNYLADVTWEMIDRKRLEERLKKLFAELERSNRELEQFAYVASHDLQEPLRMISSYTQLLAQRYEGQLDEKANKYIDYAVDGAVRMQRLINDLLAYSRVNTQGKTLEMLDSHAVLGAALRNLSVAIDESQAIIINEDLPMVRADASQMLQLFQNLIGNAIKFRGPDLPRIQISARDLGQEWRFSVKDNGIGIDAKYADKVFVIFQRLHTRQEYPGTGIGLAICKRIVERHGGRIWFESQPGQGSTFYFTLLK